MGKTALPFDEQEVVVLVGKHEFLDRTANKVGNHTIDRGGGAHGFSRA